MNEFRIIKQVKSEIQQLLDGPPVRSFRDVAEQLEMDHGNLQKFLNGQKNIGLNKFAMICKILELELKRVEKHKRK